MQAQYTGRGNYPAGLKWSLIRTPSFRVIFSEDYSVAEAQRTAKLLEKFYEKGAASLGSLHKRPFPVLLNNQSAWANGSVAWAPRRMELLIRPSQSKYAQDWTEQLVLHEYRHVVQMHQLERGIFQPLKWIFGEQGTGFSGIFLPGWFLEGDATVAETAFGTAGRGRSPSFWMDLWAGMLSGEKPPSYDEMRYGSYRRHTPDVYTVGYWMNVSLRMQKGNTVGQDIMEQMTGKGYRLDPFSFALRKTLGRTARQYYASWYDSLQFVWREESVSRRLFPAKGNTFNHRKTDRYVSYRYPQWMNDSTILAEKLGMDEIRSFVSLDIQGNEKVLFRPGRLSDGSISFAAGQLAWAREWVDPRWDQRVYSGLRVRNLQTGRQWDWGEKRFVYSPSLSPSGKFLAAVESERDNGYSLCIFRGDSLRCRIPFQSGETVQFPAWSREEQFLWVTVDGPGGRSIERVDWFHGRREVIFGPSRLNIQHIEDQGEYLLFTGDFGKVADIYALRYRDLQCFQVTTSPAGAFFPKISPSGKYLAFSEYTVRGMDIRMIAFDPPQGKPVDLSEDYSPASANRISEQEGGDIFPADSLGGGDFMVRPYHKLSGLLNLHSWFPFYFEDLTDLTLSDPRIHPGAMLLSHSLLNDMVMTLGYSWDKTSRFHARVMYSGLYPKVDLSVDYGGEVPVLSMNPVSGALTKQKYLEAKFRISLPLRWTNNAWQRNLTSYFEWNENNALVLLREGSYVKGLRHWTGGLNFSVHWLAASKDIRPKWLFALRSKYMGPLSENRFSGTLYMVEGSVGLPGFSLHHSVLLSAGYQDQSDGRLLYETQMAFPRGYPEWAATRFRKLAFEYAFPMAYPERSIPGVAYIKRLRAHLFFDVAEVDFARGAPGWMERKHLASVGTDLWMDFHTLGLRSPFSFGIRPFYRFEDHKGGCELRFVADLSVF